MDVLEIDGASNRGIDEVREIRQNVQYRPSRARYKIYIIDEVHMLTRAGLQRPARRRWRSRRRTSNSSSPPPRCRRSRSRSCRAASASISPASAPARIVEQLRQIVQREGLQADDEALELIARRAGGSMRDAQSLLDQLLAFGGRRRGGRLTVEQVHRLLGTAHDDRVVALAAAVLERDAEEGAGACSDDACDEGLQLGELLDQLIDYWRDLMVVNCAGSGGAGPERAAARPRSLTAQAAACRWTPSWPAWISCRRPRPGFAASSHGRVLVEMALVRLSRLDDLVSLAQLAQ